ncbi:MAG: aldehyde ferredoxin oxidoreductase family protein [Thermodesulfobacteriota bacterium]|nr:aldehyde ferredoxin oxidoreductase family protein [Thermodesulfobacteriota bacterium]
MYGWCGKIARINLSDQTWSVETVDPAILKKFIGGRGLAGYYLRKRITRNWNDPDMPFLIFTGPLVNTRSPTSGRMTIMSRSPLTGTVGDSSVGGSFGTELKKAGFDGIIITGKSHTLAGIEILNDSIHITDARHLAGRETGYVNSLLKGKGSRAVIGPAAENGVVFSSIIVDRHFAAGRSGIGRVSASKKIKYITVKGTGKTKIFNAQDLRKAREDVFRLAAASPVLLGEFGISRFGTGALYDLMDARCMMPTDNFRQTKFSHASCMNAHAFKKRYAPKKSGCRGCHILCKKITKNKTSIPEFETMSHFSALLDNSDINTVIRANRICNEMGMDTISAAATLACFSEISQKRLSPNEIVSLLLDIGKKRGMGTELGMGAAKYAKSRGRSDLAMAVKGQELPAYDPRGAYGMALAYAISTRGGCHLRAYPVSHEILRKPVATDRFSFKGKARIIKIGEDLNAVADSLTACKFIFFAASLEEYANIYTAVTGIKTSGQDLFKIGERIYYNERIMNAANGFTEKDDDLPGRFFNSPGYKNTSIDIDPIDREAFLKARSNYYRVRKLDKKGMPIPDAAKKLGLVVS